MKRSAAAIGLSTPKQGCAVMPSIDLDGRGERIRTSGLYVPNVALYQAKLHPEIAGHMGQKLDAQLGNMLPGREPLTLRSRSVYQEIRRETDASAACHPPSEG